MTTQQSKAIILLEDGYYLKGKSIGLSGTTTGELCFNTGMTGYQEIYTDPSYYGQIVINTNAHIGNYGTISTDEESDRPQINGMVCNQLSEKYARYQAESSLQDYLQSKGVVAISEVDTRALVRYIRSKGALNAIISSEYEDLEDLKKLLSQTPSMNGLELSTKVSTTTRYSVGDPQSDFRVAVLDLGVKRNILNNLVAKGMYCEVFPAMTSFEEMESIRPHGYFISNGPGDPSAMPYAVQTVKQILQAQIPLFGICLGHQLLALAMDIPTFKMHHGHRGINHPVKNLQLNRCEITSQNHGFGIDEKFTKQRNDVIVTHINLNDQSIEGIAIRDFPAFSVQYHPEASPGPHDATYLFEQFKNLILEHPVER